jgi:PRTRC genetic system protein E
MFTELLPVLKDRTVILTIARLDNNILRVNVVPKRKSDKENDDAENALSTPLTVTATAEELDREFGQQVRTFSGSFEITASNIRDIENAHAAAVKAAEDAKKNSKGKKVSVAQGKATARDDDSPTPTNARPVFGKPQTAVAATTQSLFDPPPAAEERSADDAPESAKTRDATASRGAGVCDSERDDER